MYNETTLIVRVDETSKKLSDTAVNMWIANEVVLELDQPDAPDVESGKSFYAQMKKKVLSDGVEGVTDGYYFTFDTGDVFYSATADGYPTLVGDTLNIGTDNGGGGSGGGGVLVVTFDGDNDTCDRTFAELETARNAGQTILGVIISPIGVIGYLRVDYTPEITTPFGTTPAEYACRSGLMPYSGDEVPQSGAFAITQYSASIASGGHVMVRADGYTLLTEYTE